ncbi:MAG: carboxymuconolactone decarboxylase family protein, partial [Candidatus Acidiferrales bacterium]
MKWPYAFCLAMTFVIPVFAQDRMPNIPADHLTEAQKKAMDERAATQKARAEACREGNIDAAKCTANYYGIHGPMVPLLRSPEVMLAANSMLIYLEFNADLPPELREIVILIAAREMNQQYVWNAHYATAVEKGVPPEILKALADGRRPEQMSSDEKTVYDFCDELYRNHGVSDPTYARALARFGEQGIIDMVSVYGV